MPGFSRRATCRAPAEEVWKLLYDPARYTEWWEGTERVELVGGEATRYTSHYPGEPFPTGVSGRQGDGRVTISCIATDIVFAWTLAPAPEGCAIALEVDVPATIADRLASQEAAMDASMGRLVAAAERAAGG